MMGMAGSPNRIHCDFEITIGPVLEPDGARKSRCHLAMQLAFGGTGPDSTPADEVCEVLRSKEIQVFRSRRNPETINRQKQLAGSAQTLVNIERPVEIGIIDQALPPHGRTGVFKIHPHDQNQIFAIFLA